MELTITDELWAQWREFVEKNFSILLSEGEMAQFKALLAALVAWNEKMNLVSFRTHEEILWRHFADSLAAARMIRKFFPCSGAPPAGAEGSIQSRALPRRMQAHSSPGSGAGGLHVARTENISVIDIGTGAGFPGIPVKIALPEIRLTLLESITKKCSFLEHAAGLLELKNVAVINDRAEAAGRTPAHRASYDIVLSRAVAKFSPNLEISVPLARSEGRVFIFKTESAATGPEGLPSVEKALASLKAAPDDRFCYSLPGTEHRYCILSFKKTGDTPPQYPRRVGIPEKKPL